jgi:hypothetical protein
VAVAGVAVEVAVAVNVNCGHFDMRMAEIGALLSEFWMI